MLVVVFGLMSYAVYILRCSDGSYYTGVTNDVDVRVGQHQHGNNPRAYTYNRRPVELVYATYFTEVHQAIDFEKRVKKWGKKKKKALIRGAYDSLPGLVICRNATHYAYYKEIACHTERSRSATRDVCGEIVSIPRLRSG